MISEDATVQAAREWMERTDPECPACKSKGAWKYSGKDILQKYDSKTDVDYVSPIVPITCGKCGAQMPHFKAQN